MKSKHVPETTTLPRRNVPAERSRPLASTIATRTVEKTKPTILRVAAATPRIITTQPAIKPHPMPIALEEEEEDLRPTFELLAPAASAKNVVEHRIERESTERGPSTHVAESKPEAQPTTSTSGPRLGVRRAPDRAPMSPRTASIASIATSIACITIVTLAVRHGRATPSAAPRGSADPITSPASPRSSSAPITSIDRNATGHVEATPSLFVESPRVDARRGGESRAPARARVETPATQPTLAHAARPPAVPIALVTPAPAARQTTRTRRSLPSVDDPNCLRRCHGSADCVVHCVREDDPNEAPSRSGMRVVPQVRDAPAVEDVRLALARLGGEVADCSNGSLTGQATVDVTFASTGHVTTAIVRVPFAGTAIGSCIARVVRSARVEPFTRRLLHVAYAYRIH